MICGRIGAQYNLINWNSFILKENHIYFVSMRQEFRMTLLDLIRVGSSPLHSRGKPRVTRLYILQYLFLDLVDVYRFFVNTVEKVRWKNDSLGGR